MKIDFGGAFFDNPGLARYGFIIQDSQGIILIAEGGPIGVSDSNTEKTIEPLKELRIVKSTGYKDCIVEGDSKIIIS